MLLHLKHSITECGILEKIEDKDMLLHLTVGFIECGILKKIEDRNKSLHLKHSITECGLYKKNAELKPPSGFKNYGRINICYYI
jgi:hypothetical protein